MQRNIPFNSRPLILNLAVALALSTASVVYAAQPERPPILPPGQSDRVVTSTAELELLEAHLTEDGLVSETVELIATTMRTTSNRDRQLLIRFDGECSAWLNAATDDEEIEIDPLESHEQIQAASVAVWVEVNGEPVPVASNGDIVDDGSIVYCNADTEVDLAATEDGDLVSLHAHSRNAAGYSWVLGDAGQGEFEVVVKARIDVLVDDNGGDPGPIPLDEHEMTADAAAIFGKRTLMVESGRIDVVVPIIASQD